MWIKTFSSTYKSLLSKRVMTARHRVMKWLNIFRHYTLDAELRSERCHLIINNQKNKIRNQEIVGSNKIKASSVWGSLVKSYPLVALSLLSNACVSYILSNAYRLLNLSNARGSLFRKKYLNAILWLLHDYIIPSISLFHLY